MSFPVSIGLSVDSLFLAVRRKFVTYSLITAVHFPRCARPFLGNRRLRSCKLAAWRHSIHLVIRAGAHGFPV